MTDGSSAGLGPKGVPVSGNLEDAPKFLLWKRTLEAAGGRLDSVTPLKILHRDNGEVLFALLEALGRDADGRGLMPYVLLRGHAVVVVTVVKNIRTGEKRFLMIRQRRIAHGRWSLEFPAGMLDMAVNDPAGVGVIEVREETGVEIAREALVPLGDRPLYSSPGLSDEAIHYYACTIEMDAAEINSLHGRIAGADHEQEHIEVGLWEHEKALLETDSLQTRLAFYLYFDWERKAMALNSV